LTTEIEQSVEARDNLKVGVARFAAERDQSKSAFLRSFAGEMSAIVVDANRVLDRFAAWQAQDARAAQQSDALRQLSTMFKERVEQFKSNLNGETVAALRRIIERLTAERDNPGADKNAIDKRIERLRAEQESLNATSPPAPPRPPKDITAPPQRPAKGKPQPRERGGI
jgi:DNA repair exonuclease SbcCD ATPase subunit